MLPHAFAGLRRRRLHLALLAALAFLLAPSTASAEGRASYDEDAYWAFADRMQLRLDALWDEHAGFYRAGSGGVEPMTNAMLLLTHSVAAMRGHDGPARADERARRLAERLVSSPPFVRRPGSAQAHAPGWVNSMSDLRGAQHLVFDAEVVDGLVYAYRARRELGLPPHTVRAIRDAIHETVSGSFWRWPAIRLNQINWYALMYAADATVTGDARLLRHDLALQLRRFTADVRQSEARAGNFGAGMRFHYLPESRLDHPMNVDSAEYANIVLSFTRFYDQARSSGMPAPSAAQRRLLAEWIRRALAGYWTHGGYMNWDSGLGFHRWHQAKKLGLTQQTLIGIASARALQPDSRWGRWAKYMLDRGFDFYERLAEREGGVPAPVFFGVRVVPQGEGSARLAAARIQANAARAITAGLGRMRSSRPPALYAYDPDIGRLAVTTPAYNTAIVAVSQRAFPYGGLDLARLFDSDQEVSANIGGHPAASFGAVVRDRRGRILLASQTPRRSIDRRVTPLRLLHAPQGAGATAAAAGTRAFAGPFRRLVATGTRSANGASARVTHRFRPRSIETSWALRRRGRGSAAVLLPSWGRGRAHVTAVLDDGSRVRVGRRRLALRRVRRFEVHSARSGYAVVPVAWPSGASARTVHPQPQSSNPLPGPTLVVELPGRRATLTVRLVPDPRGGGGP
jgi:hypothetical protein